MVVTTLDASWGFVFRPSHAREVSSQLSRDGDQRPHHDRSAESAGNVGVAPALRSPQGLPVPFSGSQKRSGTHGRRSEAPSGVRGGAHGPDLAREPSRLRAPPVLVYRADGHLSRSALHVLRA